jgi:hypothetical protein
MSTLGFDRRALCLLLGLGGLAACAVSDEGATEFRSLGTRDATEDATELRQNVMKAGRPIRLGEPLLITLKTAYIKDFTEYFANPLRALRGADSANGEIAIVANVFEDDGTTALDFGPAGLKAARVVFFSDDVDKGQFLNFHGLPLYGPLTYNGYPVVIDLYAVDLDRPGPQLRQMLENLAKIGSVAYPPGTPIAGALAQLAGTLIADDQDDKAYHHTLVQRPTGGVEGIPYSVLEAGHIVFVRSHERIKGIDWSQIALNPWAGVLVQVKEGEKCMDPNPDPVCLYRDNTYMVVEVNTAPTALAQDRQKIIFSTLRDDFAGTSPPIALQPVPAEAIQTLQTQFVLLERANRANNALGKAEARKMLPADRNAAAASFVTAWFESETPLYAASEQGLIERATARMSECGATTAQLVALAEALRTHRADTATKNAIAEKLSCAPPAATTIATRTT